MATTAKATGYLELNISGFDQALKTAKNLMATFAAGFAAYKIGDFFKDGIKDAINFGKEMKAAGDAMGGMDAGKLLLVQKAMEKTGVGAEEARGHISDFIREGRDLSGLFNSQEEFARGLKSATQDYGSQAEILTRSAKSLQSVWNTLESIGSKMRTFFMAMTEKFVGPLQKALDVLNQADLAGVGAAFGESIAKAIELLVGLFKNGDIFKVAQVGMTLAFKESVNALYEGFLFIYNTAIPMAGKMLGDAFGKAVEFLANAIEFIFSDEGLKSILDGFLGIAAKFTLSLLSGIDTVIRAMGAGVAYAIQGAVNAVPGLKQLIGGNSDFQSFQEAFDATEGIIPPETLKGLDDAAKELNGSFSKAFDNFVESQTKKTTETIDTKGKIFDTESDKQQLGDILAKGIKTGQAVVATKRNDSGTKPAEFRGDPAKAIADNLAKVGGGGNYVQVGMNLEQKRLFLQERATKATEELVGYVKGDSGGKSPQKPSVKLGR